MPPLLEKRPYRFLITTIIFLKAFLFLWYINAGFDIGDEGTGMLAYKNHAYYITFDYYRLFHLVFQVDDYSIVKIRAFKFFYDHFIIIWFSLTLIYGLFPQMKINFKTLTSICLLALTGALLNNFSRLFIYNDFTGLNVMGVIGTLAWWHGRRVRDKKYDTLDYVLMLIAGIACAVQLYIKFPQAIAVLLFANIWLVYSMKSRYLNVHLRMLAPLNISFVFTGGLILWQFGGLEQWMERFNYAMDLYGLAGYNSGALLLRYGKEDLPALVLIFFATVMLLLPLVKKASQSPLLKYLTKGRFFFAALLVIISFSFFNNGWANQINIYAGLILTLIVWTIVPLLYSRVHFNIWLLLAFTSVFPFFLTLGTNNGLVDSISLQFQVYFILAALSLPFLQQEETHRIFSRMIVSILPLFGLGLFLLNQMWYPYGLPYGMSQQTETAAGVETLKLDNRSAGMLREMKEAIERKGFVKKDPILAFEGMTGLVYFLEGTMPVIMYHLPGKDEFNCKILGMINPQEKKPLIFLSSQPSKQMLECMDNYLDFSKGYVLSDSFVNPYHRRTHLFYGYSLGETIYLYASAEATR